MNKEIGFIGVGNMGSHMAKNLLGAGFKVTVYDKDKAKTDALAKVGAGVAKHVRDVVTPSCIVITMVTDDAALFDIISGHDGIAAAMGSNEIHMTMSTISPETIVKLDAVHQSYQAPFIAAPVFGRPVAAAEKKLWIFLSGNPEIKKRVIPVLNCLGQGIYDFGEKNTAAATAKLIANFLVISAIESLGEASVLAEKNGLDSKLFMKAMTNTLFSCSAYQYHAQNIASGNFYPPGFSLALGMKDMRLLMNMAEESKTVMPFANVLCNRFASSLAKNHEGLDWAAITLNAREESGLNCSFEF
jgi:3-hydroxyisobutyrate dehydrogenase-like beta-hydroxyacid dehydrogenase